MANVIIKRRVAATNIDTYNRAAVHTADLPNGSVFALEERTKDNCDLWKVKAPAANQKGLWMATSPEVNRVDKKHGETLDPRDFTNAANKPMDATYFVPMDIIEMTGEGITGIDTAKFLVADTSYTLKAAASAPTSGGICLRKINEKHFLHIGDGALVPKAVPTYVFEVIDN